MFLDEAHETKLAQARDRNGRVHVTGSGVPPRPPAIACAETGLFRRQTTAAKFVEPGAVALPLPPQHSAQLPPQPLVQFLEHVPHSAQPVVRRPSPDDGDERRDGVLEAAAPCGPERGSQLVLQSFRATLSFASRSTVNE